MNLLTALIVTLEENLLLVSILTPLAVALAIALGLPKRFSVKLAYVGFGVPAIIALYAWYQYAAASASAYEGYTFYTRYDTGLWDYGIRLTVGLNGISLPL